MNAEELKKLSSYFQKTFGEPTLVAKARPQKTDSCELYKGDEFIGVIYKDEEDDELSYNFSMAILDIDLEDV